MMKISKNISRAGKPHRQLPDEGSKDLEATQIETAATLGHLIRARRKKSHATLVQAAGLTGVGVRFLHELEHGKQTASLGKTLQVLERMGLELWVTPRGKGWPRK